jgi:aryl-alcohol dehydrogenase-like predicted oxidoreductase
MAPLKRGGAGGKGFRERGTDRAPHHGGDERKDSNGPPPASPARQRLVERYDMSLRENQRKLEATEQLAEEAGLTLIELAIAFVANHPAVTAPIIGPRTMEHLQSQLAAADVVLDAAVLRRNKHACRI